MVDVLPSYVQGSWHTATDNGTPVLDASTGEAIAAVSSTGIDFAATVDYARSVGGPNLRRMGFRDRVGLVQRLALHLKEQKDSLYELSGLSRQHQVGHRLRRGRRDRRTLRLREEGKGRAARR